MTVIEKFDDMMKRNNGYLTTADVVAAGYSKTYLAEYIRQRNMERVAQGVYMSSDVWLDEMYIIHLRNKNAVFSHESALYMHNLIDSEPTAVMLTVPKGYNAKHLKERECRVYYVPTDIFEMGRIEKETNFGNKVYVYDMDRTICDIIRYKDKLEIQTFQTALREYMRSKDKNIHNLMKYAEKMKISDKVRVYTEIML